MQGLADNYDSQVAGDNASLGRPRLPLHGLGRPPAYLEHGMFIAIHADAERKPRAIRAAAALKLQPRQFIFCVMGPVWMFAAETHDGSGEVTGLDDEIMAHITFGACDSVNLLIDAGWLVSRDGKLLVPGWEEHEPYFHRRAYDKQRKRAAFQRKSGGSQVEVNGSHVDSNGSQVEVNTVPPVEEKRREEKRREKTTPPPPAWASELAREIARHVQLEMGTNTTEKQLTNWATTLDRLTRSTKLSPPPAAAEVAQVIRWGLRDRGDGRWPGWAAQIRSAPEWEKYAKIRRSMQTAKQQKSGGDPTW